MAGAKMQYAFTNITMDSMKDFQTPLASPQLSRNSTSSWSSTTTGIDSSAPSYSGTPPSSVASEDLVDPDIFPVETLPDSKSTSLIAADYSPRPPHSVLDMNQSTSLI